MKYLGTSSKNLIVRGCQLDLHYLQDGKDLQDILVREYIIYPLHSQPKVHNIQRGARCFGISIIVTNHGAYHLSTWTHRASHESTRNIKGKGDSLFHAFLFWKGQKNLFVTFCEIPRKTYTTMVVTGELRI